MKVDNDDIFIRMYADDIVLLSEGEELGSILLDTVNTWCKEWQSVGNQEKSPKLSILGRKWLLEQFYDFKLEGDDVPGGCVSVNV